MPQFFSGGQHTHSTYKYATIADDTSGTSADVWDPAADKRLHITGILVSVDNAGKVEIRDKTANATIATMLFSEKKAVPFELGSDLSLPKDHVLEAKYTADPASGNAFITVIGHEH